MHAGTVKKAIGVLDALQYHQVAGSLMPALNTGCRRNACAHMIYEWHSEGGTTPHLPLELATSCYHCHNLVRQAGLNSAR